MKRYVTQHLRQSSQYHLQAGGYFGPTLKCVQGFFRLQSPNESGTIPSGITEQILYQYLHTWTKSTRSARRPLTKRKIIQLSQSNDSPDYVKHIHKNTMACIRIVDSEDIIQYLLVKTPVKFKSRQLRKSIFLNRRANDCLTTINTILEKNKDLIKTDHREARSRFHFHYYVFTPLNARWKE